MRYTRYNNNHNNHNRRGRGPKNNFFFLGLLICIPLAIGIGMIFGPMLFEDKSGEGNNPPEKVTDASSEVKDEGNKEADKSKQEPAEAPKDDNTEKENFYIIQCGVYGKEENAKTALEKIPEGYNKLIAKENDKFKVIAGVYNEEDSKKKSEELTKSQVENVRVKSEIPVKDENSIKIVKIAKAYMDVLKKFENEETKSVNTEEFKKWTNELKTDGNLDENEEVKNLKKHVEELPKDLQRKDSEKSSEFLYNILNKYRV